MSENGSRLGKMKDFAKRHPIVTATAVVSTAWVAGAELLAAALAGAAVSRLVGRKHEAAGESKPAA
jgi:hypothetical protein